jgi:hypothetical protein
MLPFPLSAIEVPDAQFFAWYPNSGAPPTVGVGRQPAEISLSYGDQYMASQRELDLSTTPPPTPPDANFCAYWSSSPYYTCAQAEARGVLDMLDPLLAPYADESALDHDARWVPYYTFTEPQFRQPPCDTCAPQVCAAEPRCCTTWSFGCVQLALQMCGGIGCY